MSRVPNMPRPYSEAWLRNVLREVVKVRMAAGYPWFDAKAAARTFADAVAVNAAMGRESAKRCMIAIVDECAVGPVWLGAQR